MAQNSPLLEENNLIALIKRKGKVHIVFHDSKSGSPRICRPIMLENTGGLQSPEWEVLGRTTNPEHFAEEVERIGRKYCRACLRTPKGG